jgi:hypothetical protein
LKPLLIRGLDLSAKLPITNHQSQIPKEFHDQE